MRSEKEEKFLQRMLVEVDKESRREEVRKEKREARARKKMGVGSRQLSITTNLRKGVPGAGVSEIAFRIGESIEEVGCKIQKTFGTEECSDTSLPDERVAGGDVSKITFRIGASTHEAYRPQECLDKPLPARNVCTEKQK